MSPKITKEELEISLPDVLRNIVMEYLAMEITIIDPDPDLDLDKLSVIYEGEKYTPLLDEISFKRGFDNIITICCRKLIEIGTMKDLSADFSEKFLHDCTKDDSIELKTIPDKIYGVTVDKNIEITGQYVSKNVILELINKDLVYSMLYDIYYEINLVSLEECVQVMKLYGISSSSMQVVPSRCYHRGKDDVKEFNFNYLESISNSYTTISCNLTGNKCKMFCEY